MNCTDGHVVVDLQGLSEKVKGSLVNVRRLTVSHSTHNDSMLLANRSRLQLLACWLIVGLGLLRGIFYVIHALIEYLRKEGKQEISASEGKVCEIK